MRVALGKQDIRNILLLLSILLYVISLITPSMRSVDGTESNGTGLLLFGFTGIFIGQFAWFANIFYFLGLIFFLKKRTGISSIFLFIALLLSFNTFTIVNTVLPTISGSAGSVIQVLLPGTYLWMGSISVLLMANFAKKNISKSNLHG